MRGDPGARRRELAALEGARTRAGPWAQESGEVAVCPVAELACGVEGPLLRGSDSGYSYSLSNAVRDALEGTEYDTLIDVEVTATTGLFVPSNFIQVEGTALNSKALAASGGRR